jgi:hypothetical protein
VKLAREGCDIGLTYSENHDGAEAACVQIAGLGRRCEVAQLDLREPQRAATVIDELAAILGGVDVLVNAAGVNRRVESMDENVSGWQQTLNVNLVGAWACSRAAAKHMTAAGGGRIVNVTSILAFTPIGGGAAYAASKAGLEMLTKVMALELAASGITVNAVAPGHTATPMNFSESELDGSMIARPVIPLARAATSSEIAEAIAFLTRAESGYTTGASLLVDGGLILRSGPESLQDATGLPPSR